MAAGPDTLSFGGMMSAVQTQCPMQPMGLIIPEFVAYKATRLSDIVCRRTVKLYSDRIQTVHQQQQSDLSGNEKTWYGAAPGGRVSCFGLMSLNQTHHAVEAVSNTGGVVGL